MNKLKIHESLKNWGQTRRSIPANNETLKSEILAKAPLVSSALVERQPLPWLSLAFTVVAIVVLIGSSTNLGIIGTTNIVQYPGIPATKETSRPAAAPSYQSNTESAAGMVAPNSDYYYDSRARNLPITDTREFLKTYYDATIKTRNIPEKIDRIEIVVRGVGGRVDNKRSGEEYGSVSFAVPSSQFFSFREEIRELAGRKLIIENVNSENLLPQKQSIEAEKSQIEESIKTLKNKKTELTKNHNKIVNGYLSNITKLDKEAIALQNEWPGAYPQRQAEINYRLSQIQYEKESFEQALLKQRSNYQAELSSIEGQIRNYEQSLGYVETQDKNLLDNIATVNGTITLDKVNFWEIGELYAPGPLLFWILALAAIVSYIRQRGTLRVLI